MEANQNGAQITDKPGSELTGRTGEGELCGRRSLTLLSQPDGFLLQVPETSGSLGLQECSQLVHRLRGPEAALNQSFMAMGISERSHSFLICQVSSALCILLQRPPVVRGRSLLCSVNTPVLAPSPFPGLTDSLRPLVMLPGITSKVNLPLNPLSQSLLGDFKRRLAWRYSLLCAIFMCLQMYGVRAACINPRKAFIFRNF